MNTSRRNQTGETVIGIDPCREFLQLAILAPNRDTKFFNVHSRVTAKTKTEAERVGKYMIRPLLSLERLSLDERSGRVGYRYGKEAREIERMDYLEFIARVTSQIPDKGQVTVRYYGLYANAHRGKVKKASLGLSPLRILEEELRPIPSKGWAALINRGHVPNSLEFGTCPLLRPDGLPSMRCHDEGHRVPDQLCHSRQNHQPPRADLLRGEAPTQLTFVAERPPPPHITYQEVLIAAETPAEYIS